MNQRNVASKRKKIKKSKENVLNNEKLHKCKFRCKVLTKVNKIQFLHKIKIKVVRYTALEKRTDQVSGNTSFIFQDTTL